MLVLAAAASAVFVGYQSMLMRKSQEMEFNLTKIEEIRAHCKALNNYIAPRDQLVSYVRNLKYLLSKHGSRENLRGLVLAEMAILLEYELAQKIAEDEAVEFSALIGNLAWIWPREFGSFFDDLEQAQQETLYFSFSDFDPFNEPPDPTDPHIVKVEVTLEEFLRNEIRITLGKHMFSAVVACQNPSI